MGGARDSFGMDRASPVEVLCALALSFALNMLIGAIYKNTYRGTRYSQDYVHTLVMIGTVTTILIMVVSGNVGIAFGMFAAFSLIRFRRNLGQSRDLGFVFFASSSSPKPTSSRPIAPPTSCGSGSTTTSTGMRCSNRYSRNT